METKGDRSICPSLRATPGNGAPVPVFRKVGFTSAGFSSPRIIGQTQIAQFTGVLVNDVYAALAADQTSMLDQIDVAHVRRTPSS